ncbi:hypothetical protein ACIA5D_46625 [Actinoplanes sp. NPDC051513]|uniref:hypothetical protein n=1 Tax=Actinoplanes sp. NPDC051513 TaxID=3363908 RepID=UPI00378870DD
MAVLHGCPASAGAGLLAAAGVAGATLVTWRLLGARPSRRTSRVVVAALATLMAGTGLATASGASRAHPTIIAIRRRRPRGEPTRRFALTAGTTTGDVPAVAGCVDR